MCHTCSGSPVAWIPGSFPAHAPAIVRGPWRMFYYWTKSRGHSLDYVHIAMCTALAASQAEIVSPPAMHSLQPARLIWPASQPCTSQNSDSNFDWLQEPAICYGRLLAIAMSITHRESIRQEQIYAPALVDTLFLFGPWPLPLYYGAIFKMEHITK